VDLRDPVSAVLEHKGHALWTVGPSASVYDAIALMADKRIGALLVCVDERLVGIISERDYARKVILQGRSSRDTTVHEIMTGALITVTPQESVDACMRLMTHHRIRHLPVLHDQTVVGVVSIGDLVKWIISAQEETISHLHNYIAGNYPA